MVIFVIYCGSFWQNSKYNSKNSKTQIELPSLKEVIQTII